MQIDHEIFSMVFFSLLLIQERQLSISGERMCTRTGQLLKGLNLSGKSVVMPNKKLCVFQVTYKFQNRGGRLENIFILLKAFV